MWRLDRATPRVPLRQASRSGDGAPPDSVDEGYPGCDRWVVTLLFEFVGPLLAPAAILHSYSHLQLLYGRIAGRV